MIFHGNPLSFGQYFYDVWGGVSYWFTSALSVAQILLAALFLSQRDRMTFYVGTCTLLSLLGIYLRNTLPSPFPWYYQTGMVSTLLMSLGGVYLRYESRINKLVSKPYVFGIAAFVYLSYVMITNPAHPQGTTPDICMYLWKYLTILCSIICIIALSHLLPQAKWLEYIEKNSLIFYFFFRDNASFIRQHHFAARSRYLVHPHLNCNFHCPISRNRNKLGYPTTFPLPYKLAKNPISHPTSFA